MGATKCRVCKAPMVQPSRGRPRVTCGDTCRKALYRAGLKANRDAIDSRDTWWTPPSLREVVLDRWPIKLDTCATIESALVPEYLGPDHLIASRRNALSPRNDWAALASGGVAWMNAPYSRQLGPKFVAKAAETARAGTPVIGLLQASTSSLWWHRHIIDEGARVEFLRGRLRFQGPHSDGNAAPFSSALIIWGDA